MGKFSPEASKRGSKAGNAANSARLLGITVEEWQARRDAGERWCVNGKHWTKLENMHPTRAGFCMEHLTFRK